MTRHCRLLPVFHGAAIALVVMYAVLSLLAAACPPDVAAAEGAHHHHGHAGQGMAMHSLLCAWACQANASVEATVSHEGIRPSVPLLGIVFSASVVMRLFRRGTTHSRAPPAAASPLS